MENFEIKKELGNQPIIETDSFKQEKFPAIEVRNHVIWVNKKINSPFNFKVGEQHHLGLLLSLDESLPKEKVSFMLGVNASHSRSSDVDKIFCYDKERLLYRDIDLKGTGLVGEKDYDDNNHEAKVVQWEYRDKEPSRMMGLLDAEAAKYDTEFSEKFTKLGIRTNRTVAIIALEELNCEDGIYPINEFKKIPQESWKIKYVKYYLPKDFNPVIQVRAFGVKNRLEDIEQNCADEDTARRRVDDAISFLQKELKKEKITVPEYLEWFASTLGKNIGIMHKHEYLHGFLTRNNITLDCRIIDLDSVKTMSGINKKELEDLIELDTIGESINRGYNSGRGGFDSFRLFFQRMQTLFPKELGQFKIEKLEKKYWETYKKYSGNMPLPKFEKN